MFLSSLLYPLMPWAMLALRIALAAVFFVHGPPKIQNSQQMAGGMGMSAGMVWLVGLLETLGAVSVLLGLFTQIGALALVVVMIGAIYCKIQKWHVPFSKTGTMGWEFDLVILTAAFVLATTGAGPLSVDWQILGGY